MAEFSHFIPKTLPIRERVDRAIFEFTHSESTSLEKLYETIARSLRGLFDDSFCTVLYILEQGPHPEEPYVTSSIVSDPPELMEIMQPIRAHQGLGDWIVRHGEILIEDVRVHPPLHTDNGMKILANTFIRGQSIRAFIGVRLGSEESPIAVLYVNWLQARPFSPAEIEGLYTFINRAVTIIEEHRRNEEYRLKALENRRFEKLITYLSEHQTLIDLDSEIISLLEQASEETVDLHIVLRTVGSRWHEFWIDMNRQVQNRMLDSKDDNRRIGFFKQIAHHFQSEASDKDREHFAWKSLFHPPDANIIFVAANVRVSENCVAILGCEMGVRALKATPFRRHPHVLSRRSTMSRYAKRLAVLIRQYDTTLTLVSLTELSTSLAENYDLQAIANTIVNGISRSLRLVDAMTIYFRDDLTGMIHNAHFGVNDSRPLIDFPPHDDDAIWDLLETENPIVGDASLVDNQFCRDEHFVTSAVYPLRATRAQTTHKNIGVMFFNYRSRHHFDNEERNVLRLFAENATIALNRALQHRESEREKARLRIVQQLALAIRSLEPDKVIRTILETIRNEFADVAQNFALVEYDVQNKTLLIRPTSLEFYHVDTLPKPGEPYVVRTQEQSCLVLRAILNKEIILAPNIWLNPPIDYFPAIAKTQSQVCVPFSEHAALIVESEYAAPFNQTKHIELLKMISDYAALALQRAEEFNFLKRAKEQKWREEIAVLATGLVHDIRKIISAIPAALKEIEAKSSNDFTIKHAAPLRDIDAALAKTYRINDRLGDFLKNRRFSPELVVIKDLVAGGIELAEDYKTDLVTLVIGKQNMRTRIFVDKVWIELLLKNLLQNAYRAIERKKIAGTVRLTVKRDKERCYIEVYDTGVGVPPDKRESIFQPFYSDDKQDDLLLHGIGLYYSRELAIAHNGALRVKDSVVGKWTSMLLTLPIAANYHL